MSIDATHANAAQRLREQHGALLHTARSYATAAATNPFPSVLGDDPAQGKLAQPAQAARAALVQATAPDSLTALLATQEQDGLAGTSSPQNAVPA